MPYTKKFPITFGKTTVRNLGAYILRDQRQLTQNAYLNYLREYKRHHPTYSFQRLITRAFRKWMSLTKDEQKLFEPVKYRLRLRRLQRERMTPHKPQK